MVQPKTYKPIMQQMVAPMVKPVLILAALFYVFDNLHAHGSFG